MMKNAMTLAVLLGTAALAGTLACSSGGGTPPAEPLNCAKGTHQDGAKCVPNEPLPAPAAPAAPAAAQ